MKKLFTKIMAIVLASVSAVAMVGCGPAGGGGSKNDPSSIELHYWASGYGLEYMQKMVKAFEEDHPEYTVDFIASSAVDSADIYNRPDDNTADLYITTMEGYMGYKSYLEPLDGLLEEEVDGVKIKDKMDSQLKTAFTADDGHTYALSWAEGIGGMVYNADVFETKNYKLPKTTDEFLSLVETISADKYTPFVHYADYWEYVLNVFMAQYDGVDVYQKYWNGIWTDDKGTIWDKTDDVEEANSIKVFKTTDAKREAYKVIRALVNPKGYTYVGTNSLTHTVAQTYFLNGAGLMQPNGGWLEQEMKNTDSTVKNVKMMKWPVISALGNKLGITENQLSAVVAYVDGDTLDAIQQSAVDAVRAKEHGEQIIERVREARNIVFSEKTQHLILIPEYSNAKEGAKEFIKFYYSDKGLDICERYSGMMLPVSYSDGSYRKTSLDSVSSFVKSTVELGNQCNRIYKALNSKLLYDGGLNMLHHNKAVLSFTYSDNSSQVMTVDQFCKVEDDYFDAQWQEILTNADLLG